MLIFELIMSLALWLYILIPVNSFIMGANDAGPYKVIQNIANQTLFDATKTAQETIMNRSDLCMNSGDEVGGDLLQKPKSYNFVSQNISVKSSSTEATGIVSDGQHLFVSLNSASSSEYDLVVFNANDLSSELDKIDTGPGINSLMFVGQSLFAVNTSVSSAIQIFLFQPPSYKIIKTGDYKIPLSSSANPLYVSKISLVYPHLFIGLKKNINEELLSVDLRKLSAGLEYAIDKKWEFGSSIQAIWPIYDKYLHLLISTATEPEINDVCLDCDFSNWINHKTVPPSNLFSSLDLVGSLGNVKSLITTGDSIFVGRSAGNNELFKIKINRDYSSSTNPKDTYSILNSVDVDDGIYSMLISGSNLFLVSGKSSSTIQVRDTADISKIYQTISTNASIGDLECIADKVFGVGSVYKMSGTTTVSVMPIIFRLDPVY